MILDEIESNSLTTFVESIVGAESDEIFSRENTRRVRPSIDLRSAENLELIYSIESQPKFPSGQFIVPFDALPQVLQGYEVFFGESCVVVNA